MVVTAACLDLAILTVMLPKLQQAVLSQVSVYSQPSSHLLLDVAFMSSADECHNSDSAV